MQLISDLIDPAELVTFAREAQTIASQPFELIGAAPDTNVNTDRWQASGVSGLTPEMARFRADDTPNQTLSRPSVVRTSGELPPVGVQTIVTEREARLLATLAAQGQDDPLVNAIYDDVPAVVLSMVQRAEAARGQLLSYGGVWISENGVSAIADMGANQVTHPEQFPVAAVDWTDPAALIWSDIAAWAEAYEDISGDSAGTIGVRASVYKLILTNAEVVGASGIANVSALAPDQLDTLTDRFNMPRIVKWSKKVNIDGVMISPTPDHKAVFLPQVPKARTLWGITAHAFDWLAGGQLAVEQAGGVIVAPYRTDDPPKKYVVGAGVMLPVADDPRSLFAADVTGV